MSTALPILYSFRRCPYAMRARMALIISGLEVNLREVKLANKPAPMVAVSPKATVPVMVLENGKVLEESLALMQWALEKNDPEAWLASGEGDNVQALIAQNDGPFKHHLDRYKYYTRYEGADPIAHRMAGLAFLEQLEVQLSHQELAPDHAQLFGSIRSLADIAIFPFIRQFANHDRGWFDALDLPYLHSWLSRHLNSGLFAMAMQKFTPWQEGDIPIAFPGAAA